LNAGAMVRRRIKGLGMQQQISVITLGIADLPRSRRFYTEGFGWSPVLSRSLNFGLTRC
jgi:catechol-2,3-dioxygenase